MSIQLPELKNISSTGLFDRGSVRAYGLACALAALEAAECIAHRNSNPHIALEIRALCAKLENTK